MPMIMFEDCHRHLIIMEENMKIADFIHIMEEIAPVELKESYDNVGLMVGDREREVTRILVALDCTMDVINEAEEIGAELILSHHPLIFHKPSSVTEDTLQGRKIRALVKNDIALYSSHTNWDTVKDGLNDTFAGILGFNESRIMETNSHDSSCGIGRIVTLKESRLLKDIIKEVKEKLDLQYLRYAGNPGKQIKKIALINGSGEDFFDTAFKMEADLVITGDTTYHFVSDYNEMGLSIMDIGHYNSEWPLVKRLAVLVSEKLKENGIEVVISRETKDPYKLWV